MLHHLAMHFMSGAALTFQALLLLRQVITIFAAVGVLFIPVGAVCLAQALSVRRDSLPAGCADSAVRH